MNFELFLNKIDEVAKGNLPGHASHQKMMPAERELLMKEIDFDNFNPKIAAVLMLIYPKDGLAHLALIKRNSYGVHSSQIAFPGGKYEHYDTDFMQTALRETHEEIGVLPDSIKVIRHFTETFIPPSNFMVYPFLGVSTTNLQFILQEDEVAGIVEMPLEILLNDDNVVSAKIDTSYAKFIDVPAFQFDQHMVWGATAMMLSELKDVLKNVF